MAVLESDLVEHTTAAALEEKAKLRKHFGRFDIFFFLICTIVGLDTLGSVASYGAQAFIWLIFLGVFFFLPYAMLVAELGSTFRDEGGSYIWTKLSLGRLTASINGIMYWMSNPIWLGGTLAITAYTTFTTFFWEPSSGTGEGRRDHLRVAVHLDGHLVGDPVVRHRQVDPDDRRLGAGDAARPCSR